jgi:hypothetical protein
MGTGADAGSTMIYCGTTSDSECICSHTQASGLTADGNCTAADESAPSLCCAMAGWPNANDMGFGGCYCSKIFCETDGDVCQCGFAKPSTGDTPVTSCSAGSGEICCRGKSDIAPTCACYKGTQCVLDGDEQVPSCDPSTLACADQTVSSCR